MSGYVISGGAVSPRPGDPATVAEALLNAAEAAPSAGIGVIAADGHRTGLAYPRLLERARRVLGGLVSNGVSPGDPVMMQLSDIEDYLVGLWACLLGGIRPVALTTPIDQAGIDKVAYAWQVLDEPAVLADTQPLWVSDRRLAGARVLFIQDCRGSAPETRTHLGLPEDTVMYLTTSGSTGRPKVIPLTNRGLIELGIGSREQLGMETGDVTFNWLPLDHSGALLLYHFTQVFVAADNWHAPTEWVLAEPLRWLRILTELRVNHSWAPNFGYRLITEALSNTATTELDLTAIKTLVSGGEQILEPVVADFLSATEGFGITPDTVRPCWGMTETTTAISYGGFSDPGAVTTINGRRFVSVGEPSPGARLRVVNPAGEVLPSGHIGALQVFSARITPGYVGDVDANLAAFTADGWLDTGDLAHLWQGRLTITGRTKDLIILGGNNHDCHQIEAVVASVAGVRPGLVAAVGVPDPERGTEALGIVFVPEGPATGELISAIRQRLAAALSVSAGTIVAVTEAEFPRTDSGKIRRAVIKERLARRELTATAPAAAVMDSRNSLVRKALQALKSELDIDAAPGLAWYEQGIDSIRLPRVAAVLGQALRAPISVTTLLAHPTVDAVVSQLSDPGAGPRTGGRREQTADHKVAIIGMAGRFPGADSVEKFWDNLLRGVHSIRSLTAEELAAAGVDAVEYRQPNYVPATGVLGEGSTEAIRDFDAALFGISAHEAELIDPQQRLFLECCHQALEHAGRAGTGDDRVGLFAGNGMNLYSHNTYLLNNLADQRRDPLTAMQVAMGNQPDFLATRVAYRLGLTAPAVSVQTACSTGLVAVHLAVQSLLTGDSDLAIAGAAALHVPQATGYTFVDGTMMSPSGRCRAFDADADGTVGGNGVAAVVLKRLDRALADGDTVHAVILGSAVNNDGADKVSFTAPSVSGQVAAINRAFDTAGVASNDIDYVEAHGTGTRLGDPLEVRALSEAFAANAAPGTAPETGHCAIGSVKSNIGHLDSCAGLAGLIKSVLVLRHGTVPPQINFDRLNPHIDLSAGPFRIDTEPVRWPPLDRPRRASVQALGVGGTNAHVILEAAPTPAAPPQSEDDATVLLLSADSAKALTDLASRFARWLPTAGAASADLFTTTALGRRHYRHRLAVSGPARPQIAKALNDFAAGRRSPVVTATVGSHGPGPIGFAFSGQGALRAGFARELYDWSPVMRQTLQDCAGHFKTLLGGDLLAVLLDPGAGQVGTDLLQPALFAFQAGMVKALRGLGVQPDYVLGHSVGEYAAWFAAGAISIEDGVLLTAERGRLMRELSPPGAMVAVRADRRTVKAIQSVIPGLDLAVVNGARDHVLAGEPEAVDEAVGLLERRNVPVRPLAAERAFHSALLDPMLPDFAEVASGVGFAPSRVPLAGGLDGLMHPVGSMPDSGYLVRQTRDTMRFDLALDTLAANGCRQFIEIGPDLVLCGIGRRHLPESSWLAAGATGEDHLAALAGLHCAGFGVDWHPLSTGRRIPLPTYPFDRKTHWIDPPSPTKTATPGSAHD